MVLALALEGVKVIRLHENKDLTHCVERLRGRISEISSKFSEGAVGRLVSH